MAADCLIEASEQTQKSRPSGRLFLSLRCDAYFFSSGLDSLELEGVLGVDIAPPAELLLDELDASGAVAGASGAGVGAGVGVGSTAGALGAGGGVTVVVSSFLQAVRPTATRAAIRSERFIILWSFRGGDQR
jgi:hypothetical protein